MVAATGYLLWVLAPGFAAFAVGFVLWAVGGALGSGALEALLYDGLSAAGVPDRFSAALGRVRAAGLLAQLPVALIATVLFTLGSYPLVGWASVASCLVTALVALRLPEPRRTARVSVAEETEPGYLATIRLGLADVLGRPGVGVAVLAVAVLAGFDAVEEYFTLMAKDWGIAVSAVPIAVLVVPLAGAAGAMAGGRISGSARRDAVVLVAAATLLGAAGVIGRPIGILGVAMCYGGYRAVLVGAEARLQDRLSASTRATVTSVAGFGAELTCFAVYGAWALGGVLGAAALLAGIAAVLAMLGGLASRGGAGGRSRARRRVPPASDVP